MGGTEFRYVIKFVTDISDTSEESKAPFGEGISVYNRDRSTESLQSQSRKETEKHHVAPYRSVLYDSEKPISGQDFLDKL